MEKFFYYLFFIFVYLYKKLLSPFLGNNCRFYPECSTFFLQSIKNNGVIKGCLLFFARFIRCTSVYKGGFDYPRNDVTIKECFSLIFKYKNNDLTQTNKKIK